MGFSLSVILLVGSLSTAGPALPQAATPAPFEPGVLLLELASPEEAVSEAALDVVPPVTRAAERDFTARASRRPADFWWTSSADVLRGVYGECPVRECCKFCSKGKPCGDTCISRYFTCTEGGCGCACQRPIGDAAAP